MQYKLSLIGIFLYFTSFAVARVCLDSDNREVLKPVTSTLPHPVRIVQVADLNDLSYSYSSRSSQLIK